MNFYEWLINEEAVRTYKKENPKNPEKKFIVFYGNTFAIKDVLKNMGMRYFQGTWSIPEEKLTDEQKKELIELGVDFSGTESEDLKSEPKTIESPTQDSKSDDFLDKMQQSINIALTSNNPENAKLKNLISNIDKMIEHVANSTDEAAKQKFINNFLKFSSKFHNYSFANQMLIWVQTKGEAQHVSSASNWSKLGRTVTDWSRPILIYAPITKKIDDKENQEERKIITRFKAVKVYDITSTKPIPGHKDVFEPVQRKDWSVDSNEDIEELNVIINSLVEWIKEKNINVDYKQLSDELGGSSAGGVITINNKFKGINLFSTLIHETAHEILHWLDKKLDKTSSRKQHEIDAETTAFIVSNHFGFETKDTPNYLALWQAKGDEVRERRQNIHKASKLIIQGIEEKMKNTNIEFEENKLNKFSNLLENACNKLKGINEDYHDENDEEQKSLKEEMKDYLKLKFKGLEDVNSKEFDDDMEVAIYWFASDYHSGQWSELYSILSTSPYTPGGLMNNVKDEPENIIMLYNELRRKFKNR